MEFDTLNFVISHCLENHPVLRETLKYKTKYLNVLEYFVDKYSSGNKFASAMLENYKRIFLVNDFALYSYNNEELKIMAKGVTGIKFKNFKLFTYRYSLLYDCFFINAFRDKYKAQTILNEIKSIYKKRYYSKMDKLFSVLYENEQFFEGLDMIRYQVECWKLNCEHLNRLPFTVLTVATMSAGKSTLLNALVGKTVNRTMNDACTAKLHFIFDKAFEDSFNYELDYELNLNASHEILMQDNQSNKGKDIFVSTYFRILGDKKNRYCIIDTPGVNSYINMDHDQIAKNGVTKQKYDKLLYVVNAQNAGTNDDLKYLQFISENVDKDKIIFILNKLDQFRAKEDSISESIEHLKEDLKKLGFENPLICPVSSYAGILAKKMMFGEKLTEDESDDYEFLKRKFQKEEYNLSGYYPAGIVSTAEKIRKRCLIENPDEITLLMNCGLLCIEQIVFGGEKL